MRIRDANTAMDGRLASLLVRFLCVLSVGYGYMLDETECPHKVDIDIFSPDYWFFPGTPHRAWRTVPSKLFTIKQSSIPNAGIGVFTNTFIPKHTWLGEYEGEFWNLEQRSRNDDVTYVWRIFTDDYVTHYVDAKEDHLSNWLRFINCSRHLSEESVKMHTCYGRVYYRTRRDVAPGTELLVYYGDNYAKETLNIDVNKYTDMSYTDFKS